MIRYMKISKMYGWKDIKVDFNEDLTLLVGANGSGKTTLLNIISSLASKNLDFLNKYRFQELLLEYEVDEEIRRINIDNSEGLCVLRWNNYDIPVGFTTRDEGYIRINNREDSEPNLDAILSQISKELNILYLPLSRDNRFLEGNDLDDHRKRIMREKQRRMYIEEWNEGDNRPIGGIDDSLRNINRMVKEYQRKTGFELEQLNERMRREIFQSSFQYYDDKTFLTDISKLIGILNEAKINELKLAFKDMRLLTPKFERQMDAFISNLFDGYKIYEQWRKSGGQREFDTNILSFMGNLPQLNRIMQWQKTIQDTNQKKSELQRNMNLFLETVNGFLSESNKELILNDREGNVLFKQKHGKEKMGLEKLSSGEKQIVIFFAYLIFEVSSNKRGIYIIDEPELSLHISWQRKFAQSILNVSPSLQLIFATHSPEIVGVFRDHCVLLRSDR
ncbi:AAA family ATPase [Paenibacillus fonticola]|uniref:AAA family ATPase n=1 Tax=Paenibacillus fonticola TaxID=379896 RepID=UPI000362BE11|nr:AAA family ATPase [Paenibacillus fonticola]